MSSPFFFLLKLSKHIAKNPKMIYNIASRKALKQKSEKGEDNVSK